MNGFAKGLDNSELRLASSFWQQAARLFPFFSFSEIRLYAIFISNNNGKRLCAT